MFSVFLYKVFAIVNRSIFIVQTFVLLLKVEHPFAGQRFPNVGTWFIIFS